MMKGIRSDMKTRANTRGLWTGVLLVAALMGVIGQGTGQRAGADKSRADKMMEEGNFREAAEIYRSLVDGGDLVGGDFAEILGKLIHAMERLGEVGSLDGLLVGQEGELGEGEWEKRLALATAWQRLPKHGHVLDGEFRRGQWGPDNRDASAHDRVRALRLYESVLRELGEMERGRAGEYLRGFAGQILGGGGHGGGAWRLGALTELREDIDIVGGLPSFGGGTGGAPVDEEGRPVFHELPESWEAAASDGERWRWVLGELGGLGEDESVEARFLYADFVARLYGVETLGGFWGGWRGGWDRGERGQDEGVLTLHTLTDEETTCRLATGVRRIRLPAAHNPVLLYRELLEDKGGRLRAASSLAGIYENRNQLERAAEMWLEAIEAGGDDSHRERLEQIVAKRGQFDGTMAQVAGQPAEVGFVFRNGEAVEFTAWRLKDELLLADVIAYLDQDRAPDDLDWSKMQIGNLGHRVVAENQGRYRGEQVAEWRLGLEPAAGHWEKRIDVTTPLREAGAYLIESKMEGGHRSFVVVWLADTVLVRKPMAEGVLYLASDAETGAAVGAAKLELFGWKVEHRAVERNGRQVAEREYKRRSLSKEMDGEGVLVIDQSQQPDSYQWLAVARGEGGRLAVLGFQNVWFPGDQRGVHDGLRGFAVTDRPVYRPEQEVKFKAWMRRSTYEERAQQPAEGTDVRAVVRDPQGTEVLSMALKMDGYGGVDGSYSLPAGAPLGMYAVEFHGPAHAAATFRVEEYKKPEFEVLVEAPDGPIALGESFEAIIKADYYFGGPVTSGVAKIKVQRHGTTTRWYPPRPWDWLYGEGYWWRGADSGWHPGWDRWGCLPPMPWWHHWSPDPPELVLEQEVELGEDGRVELEIDTALALELHGDKDHRYEITAEVIDNSRRTIVGGGQVLVARKPFSVTVWPHRGFYRVGDDVEIRAVARTPDGKVVRGEARLAIYRLGFGEGGEVEETEVAAFELEAADELAQRLVLAGPGQYRASVVVSDEGGHEEEGGYLFVVRGRDGGAKEEDYRFTDLELVPDKGEYAVGDRAELLVSTARGDGRVALFVRPENGIYGVPQWLEMDGKSQIVELDIGAGDRPNLFVEAVTVADGKVYSVAVQLAVPPDERVLKVEIEASEAEYLPGGEAEVSLVLTTVGGEPFEGSTVLTVYDQALEYIAGGPGGGDIREIFWGWKRHHQPRTDHSLMAMVGQLMYPPQGTAMAMPGIFGWLRADLGDEAGGGGQAELRKGMIEGRNRGVEARSGAMLGARMEMDAAPMAAMAAMAAPGGVVDGLVMADAGFAEGGGGGAAEPMAEAELRQDFADSAYWVASITTDAEGRASVRFPLPDDLTRWVMRAWSMGRGAEVGSGSGEFVTTKNVLVRLAAPRFFVEKDEVLLSGIVRNGLEDEVEVAALLELDGGVLELMEGVGERQVATLGAGEERRFEWRVLVKEEGEAVVRVKAMTAVESDAAQLRFPAYVHGMLKTESWSLALRPEAEEGSVLARVPEERRPEQTVLELRFSPTIAGAMVDALPYLVDYPHHGTDHTLHRFVPTVMVQKILMDMNLDLADIRTKRANLNPAEIGDAAGRAQGWARRWGGERSPVFDEVALADMVEAGVKRLEELQVGDGGWGWFGGPGSRSNAHSTATVVHGLSLARENDVAVGDRALRRGVRWLENYEKEELRRLGLPEGHRERKLKADNLDAWVHLVLVEAGSGADAMRARLYQDRIELALYAKALVGIACHLKDEVEWRDMLLRNIDQFVKEDDENQTAWLEMGNRGYWWWWYGNEIEASAFYLKLLSLAEPGGDRASRLAKWLLNNRKNGSYWGGTRDTAYAVEALAAFWAASGEAEPDMEIEVLVGGESVKKVRVTKDNLFSFDNSVLIEGEALGAGEHEITFRKVGEGPLYANAYLTYFTLEDLITAAGLEVKVERKLYLMEEVVASSLVASERGDVVEQDGLIYRRVEIGEEMELVPGSLVEVELSIEAKNDYEKLMIEDMKAATFEPVDVRSGYVMDGLWAYRELRDERVVFFVENLPQGRHNLRYRVRAEVPGRFSALPTRAVGVYAPEVRANSDEAKVVVGE